VNQRETLLHVQSNHLHRVSYFLERTNTNSDFLQLVGSYAL